MENCCDIAFILPCKSCGEAALSLCYRYAIAAQFFCNAAQLISNRSAIVVISIRNRYVKAAQSLHSHYESTFQRLCKRFAITAQMLRNCCRICCETLKNHCRIALKICEKSLQPLTITTLSLQNHHAIDPLTYPYEFSPFRELAMVTTPSVRTSLPMVAA
jgi:hypothetical protein